MFVALTFAPEPQSALASTPAACETSNSAPTWNSATEKFEISTPQQLIYLSQNFGDPKPANQGVTGDWRAQSFVLKNDINLGGCNFTPIGSSEDATKRFTGTFDGAGNAIRGLVSEGSGRRGLFAESDEATFVHLRLVDVSISSSNSSAGGLVAETTGQVSISKVFTSGTVSALQFAGGIAGGLQAGTTIKFSGSAVNVSSTTDSSADATGGITGFIVESGTFIENSYARGSVTGTSQVGGLLGSHGSQTDPAVDRTFAKGLVTGSGSHVGGLVGLRNTAGGVSPGLVTASFWDTDSSGQTASAGGTGKSIDDMKDIATYTGANWKIVDGWAEFDEATAVWGICPQVNEGYPYLLWEYEADPCVSVATDQTQTTLAAAIHLDAGFDVGLDLARVTILAEGQGLAAGESYTLSVLPQQLIITQGTASRTGSFSARFAFPVELPAGNYRLQLETRTPSAEPLVLTRPFSVDAQGVVVDTVADQSATGQTAPFLRDQQQDDNREPEPDDAPVAQTPEAEVVPEALQEPTTSSVAPVVPVESTTSFAWVFIPIGLVGLALAIGTGVALQRRRKAL